MKKAFLLLLLFGGVCCAEEFGTLYNYASFPIYVQHLGGEENFAIAPGNCLYLSKSWRVSIWIDYSEPRIPELDMSLYPVTYLDDNGAVSSVGEWPVNMIGTGFGFGCSVAGAMLIFWIMGLLKRPIVET